MSDHHTTDVAVRIAALPLLGVLGAVSAVRDQAARLRLREDDPSPSLPLQWDRLSARQRANLVERRRPRGRRCSELAALPRAAAQRVVQRLQRPCAQVVGEVVAGLEQAGQQLAPAHDRAEDPGDRHVVVGPVHHADLVAARGRRRARRPAGRRRAGRRP